MKMSVKTEAIIKTIVQIVGGVSAFAAFMAVLYFVLTTEPIMTFLDKYLTLIILAVMVVPLVCAGIGTLYSSNLADIKAKRATKQEEKA